MPKECIFCQIIKKEVPSVIRYEDDKWLVFDDLYKIAPTHVLLIPKHHVTTLEDVAEDDRDFYADMIITAKKVAKQIGIGENYKIFMNIGMKVQAIHHVHLHIYGGWAQDKSTEELDKESRKLINE